MGNVIEAGGQVASDVVGGLKNQPGLLALIVLNLIGLVVAGWLGKSFIDSVDRASVAYRTMQADMLRLCFDHRGGKQAPLSSSTVMRKQ